MKTGALLAVLGLLVLGCVGGKGGDGEPDASTDADTDSDTDTDTDGDTDGDTDTDADSDSETEFDTDFDQEEHCADYCDVTCPAVVALDCPSPFDPDTVEDCMPDCESTCLTVLGGAELQGCLAENALLHICMAANPDGWYCGPEDYAVYGGCPTEYAALAACIGG